MSTRALVLLSILGLCALALLAVVLAPPKEPVYEGMKLHDWLHLIELGPMSSYGNPNAYAAQDRAQEVVRNAGTNVVPWLLRMIRTKDSAITHVVNRALSKQTLVRFRCTEAKDLRRWAIYGFRILGPQAKCAVPELTGDLTGADLELRDYANCALKAIEESGQKIDK
jgi:hypothetical protein